MMLLKRYLDAIKKTRFYFYKVNITGSLRKSGISTVFKLFV